MSDKPPPNKRHTLNKLLLPAVLGLLSGWSAAQTVQTAQTNEPAPAISVTPTPQVSDIPATPASSNPVLGVPSSGLKLPITPTAPFIGPLLPPIPPPEVEPPVVPLPPVTPVPPVVQPTVQPPVTQPTTSAHPNARPVPRPQPHPAWAQYVGCGWTPSAPASRPRRRWPRWSRMPAAWASIRCLCRPSGGPTVCATAQACPAPPTLIWPPILIRWPRC